MQLEERQHPFLKLLPKNEKKIYRNYIQKFDARGTII